MTGAGKRDGFLIVGILNIACRITKPKTINMKEKRLTYETPQFEVYEMHLQGCIASSLEETTIENFRDEEDF